MFSPDAVVVANDKLYVIEKGQTVQFCTPAMSPQGFACAPCDET
jgi:hypothetical protein